ncbi:MAG: hypothetical protein ACRESV_11420, partial [Nevskiales bacterium]
MRDRALSDAARRKVLQAASNQLLIGGQALAWWAARFVLDTQSEFPEGVTFDFDFLAGRREAAEIHRQLGGDLHIATLDDNTSQTAKIFLKNLEGDGPV